MACCSHWTALVLLLLLINAASEHADTAPDYIFDATEQQQWPAYPPGPAEGGSPPPQSCPSWLEDYARFHKEQRGKPDATYLMFGPCSQTVKCTGLGDRIKSSMTLLRLAAIHNKVLLLSWDYPVSMTTFIEPNQIDWRYDEQMQRELQNVTSEFDTELDLFSNLLLAELILKGQKADAFRRAKVVKSQAVRDFNLPMHGQSMHEINTLGYTFLGRCFFRLLFKTTDMLMDKAEQVLQDVYGSRPKQYVAWHWRSGGLVGEQILDRAVTTKVEGTSRLHQLLAATKCAHDMASQRGLPPLSKTPMLLITDHNIIRQWVASGELANVVTVNQTVVHIRHKNLTVDDVINNWVDIALLSRAHCLLMSHSGFSWVGLLMGNATCWQDLKMCIQSQKRRFARIEV